MKRQWQLRRELVATPAGQQRWDRAYQVLLHWAMPATVGPRPAPDMVGLGQREEEVGDGYRDLCTGVDPAAGARADD